MKVSSIALKALVFFTLALLSLSASAMYLGNPVRPDTVWVPGHYVGNCWVDGHYLKFVNPPISANEVVWVPSDNNRTGHYMPVDYVIVNSHAM